MATFQSSQVIRGDLRPRTPTGLICLTASLVTTTPPALNDVYQMVMVPAGFTVFGGAAWATDMDTGTNTIVFTVGDGLVTNRYLGVAGGTIAQAGGSAVFASAAFTAPFTYAQPDTIDILITTGPNVGANGTFNLAVFGIDPLDRRMRA